MRCGLVCGLACSGLELLSSSIEEMGGEGKEVKKQGGKKGRQVDFWRLWYRVSRKVLWTHYITHL